MKEQIKYDPEDIESLLLHKEYHDLYAEEREFVLQHMDNEEEYNSMRAMLLTISSSDDFEEIEPQPKTLALLMEEFVTEEKRGFKWWLNSLFVGIFPKEKTWFRQPGFQMAMVMGIVVLGFVFVQQSSTNYKNIAEAKTEKKENMPVKPSVNKDRSEAKNISQNSVKSSTEGNITKEPEEITTTPTEITLDCTDISSPTISATDNCDNDVSVYPVIANLERDSKKDYSFHDNTSEAPVLIEVNNLEVVEDDAEIVRTVRMEDETDKFDIDNQIGNTSSITEVQNIKTNTGNNGFFVSSSLNLAADEDLIGLLFTAP